MKGFWTFTKPSPAAGKHAHQALWRSQVSGVPLSEAVVRFRQDERLPERLPGVLRQLHRRMHRAGPEDHRVSGLPTSITVSRSRRNSPNPISVGLRVYVHFSCPVVRRTKYISGRNAMRFSNVCKVMACRARELLLLRRAVIAPTFSKDKTSSACDVTRGTGACHFRFNAYTQALVASSETTSRLTSLKSLFMTTTATKTTTIIIINYFPLWHPSVPHLFLLRLPRFFPNLILIF